MSSGISYESRYYAGSGFHIKEHYTSALRCAKHIDEYLDVIEAQHLKSYKKPLMVVVGYSNGAVDAVGFQNALPDKMDRPIDLALTIDPIAKALFYHPNKLIKYAGSSHKSTKSFINFYQTIDYLSLGTYLKIPYLGKIYAGFEFKGKPIFGADINKVLNIENYSTFKFFDGAYAHVTILDSDLIWDTFRSEIQRLNFDRVESSYD